MMACQNLKFLIVLFGVAVGGVTCHLNVRTDTSQQPPSTQHIRSNIWKNLNNYELGKGPLGMKRWLFSNNNFGFSLLNLETSLDVVKNNSSDTNNGTALPIKKTVVSKPCLDDINLMLDLATQGEQWALKVADSFAKPPSGILEGNTVWLGSFDECRSIRAKVNVTGSIPINMKSKIWTGKYCTCGVAPVGKESQPSLTVGVCLSETCTENDTEALINRGLLVLPGEMVARGAKCQLSSSELTTGPIIVIVILSLLGCLLVAGTIYDIILRQMAPPDKEFIREENQDHMSCGPIESTQFASKETREKTPLINGSSKNASGYPADTEIMSAHYIQTAQECNENSKKTTQTAVPEPSDGVLGQILLCFSVCRNVENIFTVRKSPDTIDCLHGIHFISMTWVILGHSFFFAIMSIENVAIMPQILKRWTFLVVENASLAVDTFFLLSGLLSSHHLIKEIIHRGGPLKINWFLFYFHRYWRLTPAYMLLLAANATLFVYMGDGPQWPQGTYEQYCTTHWWTNLLYINNLVYPNTQCMASTWYLANNMQYFVIMPLLVIALYKSLFLGVAVNVILIVASFIATALITVANSYTPTTVIGSASWGLNTYFPDVYTSLYTRIGPYLIGVIMGYALMKIDKKLTVHKGVVIFAWLASVVVCLATVYGPYGENAGYPMSASVSAFYAAVHRTSWAIGVSWIVIACITNCGGVINRILSWSGFVPLSRLTYMAYLVHPIVLYYYLYRLRQRIYYDDYSFMYIHLGNLVMSYAVALVASLSLEAPMIGLEKILLKQKKLQ